MSAARRQRDALRRAGRPRPARRRVGPAGWVCAACLCWSTAGAAILRVGPGAPYPVPSAAARVARDFDTVLISAGEYRGDVAVWRQRGLTLRGSGGYARLLADGHTAEDKAIWVIKGDDTLVEWIEFAGARSGERNAAGIRQEGAGLTVRHCRFLDNQNGILAGHRDDSDILIEHSEFARNGQGDGYSHNIYIGRVRSFTLSYSYLHHARVGHQVKTRAAENYLLNNRLMDEADGTSSYLVDIAEGGLAFVLGNLLQQGEHTENSTLINYSPPERPLRVPEELHVTNNTLVNARGAGTFVANRNPQGLAFLTNNLLLGKGEVLSGEGQLRNNLRGAPDWLVDEAHYDYRLRRGSPAVDGGAPLGIVHGFDERPLFEYQHPAQQAPRAIDEQIDVGAYELAK